jgi:hypothetical protein
VRLYWQAFADAPSLGGYRRLLAGSGAAADFKHRALTLLRTRAAGAPAFFERVLAQVRTEHRPKRNLMALLDAEGW